jgi:hypothetical protein
MKITRRQLRRIIKEEKAKLLEQSRLVFPDGTPDPAFHGSSQGPFEGQDIIDGYYNAINQMIHEDWAGAGVDPQESPKEVSYVAQALRNLLKDLERGQF